MCSENQYFTHLQSKQWEQHRRHQSMGDYEKCETLCHFGTYVHRHIVPAASVYSQQAPYRCGTDWTVSWFTSPWCITTGYRRRCTIIIRIDTAKWYLIWWRCICAMASRRFRWISSQHLMLEWDTWKIIHSFIRYTSHMQYWITTSMMMMMMPIDVYTMHKALMHARIRHYHNWKVMSICCLFYTDHWLWLLLRLLYSAIWNSDANMRKITPCPSPSMFFLYYRG